MKFLIRINGTILVHLHVYIVSIQFYIKQNSLLNKMRHATNTSTLSCLSKALNKKSQIFRNILFWSKSLSQEANVNIPTGFGVVWHWLVLLEVEEKIC